MRSCKDIGSENCKELTNSIGMKFNLIPAGEFLMGAGEADDSKWIQEHSVPAHKVNIPKPFYMGIYQVTQAQWKTVMGSNPSKFIGDELPVEKISWDDCQEFIEKLNGLESTDKYRLPTEAQWEYACRGGAPGKWSFGDDASDLTSGKNETSKENGNHLQVDENMLSQYAWHGEDYETGGTHPVGTKKPNAHGLYDMHGNVCEWCQDTWNDNYHGAPIDGTAWEGEEDSDRVGRGGSWASKADECSSAQRLWFMKDLGGTLLGFRLVREL